MENNNKTIQHWFLHIDLDAFFASVEQLDNPSYRGKPVIVGGRKDDKRGVVSTASYEAREFGVHSAMPLFQAIKLCPQGIYVRGRMERYAELSYQIMNIFREFSPDVEQMSIDEAFIDLTGTEQLFGPPEETAIKVKKRVKDLTGLTVSVGLATTKYIAKIASGYSKPDGFYFVRPGEEKNFMLNIPLQKVWGVGPKALERLKKSGINSTRDIYEKPLDLLNFLFGSTMGTFLYKVVRGEETETFSKKRKSHSISAENTFSCDITDIYTAETALLELAHGVMFRMLKEEKYSKTVTVKIKYDDFTTVSIQKTLDRNVMTLDTFFDNIKVLFEQKYIIGRGIRLLGVGFDKVESEEKPYQQSLFDEKEDKKQAVEKAILGINKKHPEIKIQKARLLKSICFLFITVSAFLPFTYNNFIYANELPIDVSTEDSSSLIKTESIEVDISGKWQVDLLGNFKSSFGKNTSFNFAPTIPVFKQDIELSSLFILNGKWYFQGDFADNFANNTIAIGYNGTENNYFRSGRISNRNITMPTSYSAEHFGFGLSGGNNQAPGFSAHWQAPSNKWSADLLLRYDMTTGRSATFHGLNKVNNKIINPENYLYGHSYTFPDTSKNDLLNIKNIFIEDSTGKYKDSYGKLYRKLSTSEYYYSSINNILYLSHNSKGYKENDHIPSILITFNSPEIVEKIISDTGDFNDKSTFAGQIQQIFNKSNKKYNLTDYSYKLKRTIENEICLVIQNSIGFSPYIVANSYLSDSKQNKLISVISKTNGIQLKDFVCYIDNNIPNNNNDFLENNIQYTVVENKKINTNQFPFALDCPEIYLNITNKSDLGINISSLSKISELNIGTKAATGTIQIYRNNNFEPDFVYNKKTGSITLSSPINYTDNIKIFWQEESNDFSSGAFSVGLGYKLNILPNLLWDISFTAQKPINFSHNYFTSNNILSSYIALSTGITYKYENFLIEDKAVIYGQKHNDLGKLLVSTQSDFSPKTFYLDKNDGYTINNNIKLNNIILNQNNNCTIKNHIGVEDKNQKGYKIPLQWIFSKNNIIKESNKNWAAVDIKLDGGKYLKNTSKVTFNLQIPDKIDKNEIEIYLQIGNKINSTNNIQDNNLPTFNITNLIDYSNNEWQKITVNLDEKAKPLLVSNFDCRFIIISKNSQFNKGKIYIGPYTLIQESINTTADENVSVFTTTVPSSEKTFSSQINWTLLDNSEEKRITASNYFQPADFSQYKTINIKFGYSQLQNNNKNSSLTIILDEGYNGENKQSITFTLDDISSLSGNEKQYHIASINIENKTLKIDGNYVKNNGNLKINYNSVPCRVKYIINTYNDGCFYVDDITYEGSDIIFGGENHLKGNYRKDDIIKLKDYSLISNGFIETTSNQKFTKNNITVLSELKSGIMLGPISLQGDFALNKNNFKTAGHIIKTKSPIFSLFSFNEEYRWNKFNNSLNKNNGIDLSLSKYNIPLIVNSKITAYNDEENKTQNHSSSLNFDFDINNNNINYTTSFNTSEIVNNMQLQSIKNNYFEDWYSITKFQFSIGDESALSRKTSFTNNFKLSNDVLNPSISYNLISNYENKKETTYHDTSEILFNFPISINNHFISFSLNKVASGIEYVNTSGNYFDDIGKLFAKQRNRQYLYTSIPFYELFDNYFIRNIEGNYSTEYEITYKKSLYNSIKDLFIPSTFTLSLEREIKKQNSNKISNLYEIKAEIKNQSINNLGKQSSNNIFNWFNQEEINSSVSAIVKIPTDMPENTTFKINSFIHILFMINDFSQLQTTFDFSVETNNNWTTGGNLVYSRPGKSCFISALAGLFSEKAKNTKYDISRKDSFNYKLSYTNKLLKQEYSYNHVIDMAFLKYFTVSSGLGCTFANIQNNGNTLSLNYSIGGKAEF